ncbi:hypothetical protein [Micromonospora narathiwatensis]|uniref:Lipoprotein n=1 Tax=Micromonospora narathiwatensis TaxID=299146 RepID=A0A1A9A842_9ACTN|nr:hypothetical protein [Micromonospora narathiwatensis]SBT52651.1 hypothetical protein GA0070621_4493 [Micromonospora narathiwatensis]
MARVSRSLAALLTVATLAGCGPGEPSPGRTWSPPDPVATASGPTPALTPPSEVERVTFEQAMARYVTANYPKGTRYVGDCETAKPDPRGVCGLKKVTVDAGEVWGIGVPYSEFDGFLLLAEGEAGWRVADAYAPAFEGSGTGPRPTPSWFVGVG